MVIKSSEQLTEAYRLALSQEPYDGLSGLFTKDLMDILWTWKTVPVPSVDELIVDSNGSDDGKTTLAAVLRIMEACNRMAYLGKQASATGGGPGIKGIPETGPLPTQYWKDPYLGEDLHQTIGQTASISLSRHDSTSRRGVFISREEAGDDYVPKASLMCSFFSCAFPGFLEDGLLPSLPSWYAVCTVEGSSDENILLGLDPVMPYISSYKGSGWIGSFDFGDTFGDGRSVDATHYNLPKSVSPSFLLECAKSWMDTPIGSAIPSDKMLPLPYGPLSHSKLPEIWVVTPVVEVAYANDSIDYTGDDYPKNFSFMWHVYVHPDMSRAYTSLGESSSLIWEDTVCTSKLESFLAPYVHDMTGVLRANYYNTYFPFYRSGAPGSSDEGLFTSMYYYMFSPYRSYYSGVLKDLKEQITSVDITKVCNISWTIPDGGYGRLSDLPHDIKLTVKSKTKSSCEYVSGAPELSPAPDNTHPDPEYSSSTHTFRTGTPGGLGSNISPGNPITSDISSIWGSSLCSALGVFSIEYYGTADFAMLRGAIPVLNNGGLVAYDFSDMGSLDGSVGTVDVSVYYEKVRNPETGEDVCVQIVKTCIKDEDIDHVEILGSLTGTASWLRVSSGSGSFADRYGFGLSSDLLDLEATVSVDVLCSFVHYGSTSMKRSAIYEYNGDKLNYVEISGDTSSHTATLGHFIVRSLPGKLEYVEGKLELTISLADFPNLDAVRSECAAQGGTVPIDVNFFPPSSRKGDGESGGTEGGGTEGELDSDGCPMRYRGEALYETRKGVGGSAVVINRILSTRVPFKPFSNMN